MANKQGFMDSGNGEQIPVMFVDNGDGTWALKVAGGTGGGGGGGDASAANQVILNGRIGDVGDVAWASGNGSVIALLKAMAAQAVNTAPVPIVSLLGTGTDRSGSITTGGTAQTLAAANANRRRLYGQNTSAGDLFVNQTGGAAVVNGAGSYKIVAGASFEVQTTQAISIIGATTGQTFVATEVV